MYRLLSGLFLGWALGANDSANVFGTAVSSRMIRYRNAVILTALFALAGAVLQGYAGLKTISGLTVQTAQSAFTISMAAAFTVTLMTIFKLPISTSQARLDLTHRVITVRVFQLFLEVIATVEVSSVG